MTSERCCTLTNISCWQKNKYRYRCGNWSATWGSGTYGAAQAKGWSWHAPSCLECGDAVQGRARCCLRWGGPRFSWWVYSKLVLFISIDIFGGSTIDQVPLADSHDLFIPRTNHNNLRCSINTVGFRFWSPISIMLQNFHASGRPDFKRFRRWPERHRESPLHALRLLSGRQWQLPQQVLGCTALHRRGQGEVINPWVQKNDEKWGLEWEFQWDLSGILMGFDRIFMFRGIFIGITGRFNGFLPPTFPLIQLHAGLHGGGMNGYMNGYVIYDGICYYNIL